MKRNWFDSVWDRLLLPPRKARPMGLVSAQMSINPFELFWLAGCCIVGVLYLIGFPPPSSVREQLPGWALNLWAANLGIGGIVAMIGGMWHRALDKGLAAYQFGWGQIGLATLVYGTALWVGFGTASLFPAVINILWAFACFYRLLQVQRLFALSERVQRGETVPVVAHLPIVRPKGVDE